MKRHTIVDGRITCPYCAGGGKILGRPGTHSDMNAVQGPLNPDPLCEECKGVGSMSPEAYLALLREKLNVAQGVHMAKLDVGTVSEERLSSECVSSLEVEIREFELFLKNLQFAARLFSIGAAPMLLSQNRLGLFCIWIL